MKVFLSYSLEDKSAAEEIRSGLSSAGLNVWEEFHDVAPGENWAKRIGTALERSDAMIVLISPEAVKSRSVRREIDYAIVSGSDTFQFALPFAQDKVITAWSADLLYFSHVLPTNPENALVQKIRASFN
jgi:hypothetical protein